MKKNILFGFLCVPFLGFSQTTIFQENWDSIGPGISGWTLYNIDGLTPVDSDSGGDLSSLVLDAWNVLSPSQILSVYPDYPGYPAAATGMSGNVIACNSWYEPVGAANDWLVSPLITIPSGASNIQLSWAALSLGDVDYLEDYEVYISPSGGNLVTDFTNLLLDVNEESFEGSLRTVSLNGFAGTSVRVAFRDNSIDKYVMFLDDIKITTSSTLTSDSFHSNKVIMYPNPAKNILNINSGSEILVKVSIFDDNGRLIKEINNNLNCINLDFLNKGIYMVTIESETTTKTEKLIIDK